MCRLVIFSLAFGIASCVGGSASAALYAQDFDIDDSANWTTNNNGNGTNAVSYFFDYSTVGILSAPHSTGGTRIGMKLQANISGTGPASGILPGISVSPTGQSFTGDYRLRFDWWHNWIGSTTTGIANTMGGSGSTQLSTFGVLTTGTTSNYAGSSDSVFFAATPDGASASDYRVYSRNAQNGHVGADVGVTYHAASESQNNTAALYTSLFPAGATVPASQNTAFPGTQFGTSVAGTAGFRWHDVEITKSGSVVTWRINGVLVATIDYSTFALQPLGTNILFGQADTSLGAGTPAATFAAVDFTLIDNIVVEVIPEPSSILFGGLVCGVVGVAAGFRRLAGKRKDRTAA